MVYTIRPFPIFSFISSGKTQILVAALLTLNILCKAQQPRCGTNFYHSKIGIAPQIENIEQLKKKNSLLKIQDLTSTIITIPVVVHVVHHDPSNSPRIGSSSNIRDNQIYSQIRVLNEDFRRKRGTNGDNQYPFGADVGIEFCLASVGPNSEATSGINRIYHPKAKWNVSEEVELKSLSYWPSDSYLNIWVTELDGLLGYAKYPNGTTLLGIENSFDEKLDGVVIDYRAFGTNGSAKYPYNLGRTTTHEIGHWLGLLHVWGAFDEIQCGDDYVYDTPEDQAANNDDNCTDSSNCTGERIADITSNYLDFSPDRCMNLFTIGQKQRIMRAIAESPNRNSILNSKGCSLNPVDDFNTIIYPVPTKSALTIETHSDGYEEVEISIRDYNGRVVFESKFDFTFQTDYQLNVAEFNNGFYAMKLTKNGKEKLFKFIVLH